MIYTPVPSGPGIPAESKSMAKLLGSSIKLIFWSFVAVDPTSFLASALPVVKMVMNNKKNMAHCKNIEKRVKSKKILGE